MRGAAVSEFLGERSLDEFDYVIAGGGTAGCVVAARLSEDPDVTVCLLEAGPSDVGDENILVLADWMHLLDSGYDWDYPVEPQENGNSFLRHARAKVLGGCSSHNSCIAFHPPREGLDAWEAAGCTGWGADDVLPLVRRLEDNAARGPHHGTDGPVRLRDIPPVDPCGVALLQAAAAAGLPTVQFNRGETVLNGAGWFQINAGEAGDRMSTSHAYLHPVMDRRPNLEVRTGHWVERIVVEPGPDGALRATGVEFLAPDLVHHGRVTARREVVLSAGSIDTPKLLMLSGIGPAAQLKEFGLDVLVDAPGVGENLDDHVEGLVFWDALQPMVTASSQWWEIGVFATTGPGLTVPDLMMHYGSVPFDMNTVRWGYPTTDNGFCLTPNVTQGRSRGTVKLRSRDFRDRPRVDPRYFTDPEGHDLRVMTAGVRLARTIVEQSPMAAWAGVELAPGPDVVTDDEIADYVTKTHNTVYHPSCTAKMGADDDLMAVCDPRLRVRGVAGLRIADGSIMPFLGAVNPNITTMAIGEKCADMIAEDARV
nr:GMC oxidoreductase [Kineococcus siccus]